MATHDLIPVLLRGMALFAILTRQPSQHRVLLLAWPFYQSFEPTYVQRHPASVMYSQVEPLPSPRYSRECTLVWFLNISRSVSLLTCVRGREGDSTMGQCEEA